MKSIVTPRNDVERRQSRGGGPRTRSRRRNCRGGRTRRSINHGAGMLTRRVPARLEDQRNDGPEHTTCAKFGTDTKGVRPSPAISCPIPSSGTGCSSPSRSSTTISSRSSRWGSRCSSCAEGARRCAPASAGWNDAARFWIRIFGINFAVGVVTGIPMEFQFGTNWAALLALRRRRHRPDAGDGRPVRVLPRVELPRPARLRRAAPGAARPLPRGRSRCSLGSWLSGYFIICTNAFMQHPVGHAIGADGTLQLADFWAFVLNPWALAQYAHNHGRGRGHGVVRGGGGGRLLRAARRPRRARAALPARRHDRRPRSRACWWRSRPATAGQAGGAAPAGGAGGDGGPLRERADGRASS